MKTCASTRGLELVKDRPDREVAFEVFEGHPNLSQLYRLSIHELLPRFSPARCWHRLHQ